MIASLFCVAIGLGIVFAWTRSLIPSIIAHAIINVPMTPVWQGVLLVVFAIGGFFAWLGG
jgi:membrane protease YdiL (CAAX protease family)